MSVILKGRSTLNSYCYIPPQISILIVGGGGGGAAGGGGGGGVVYNPSILLNSNIVTEFTVTVGQGGAGSYWNSSTKYDGSDSSITFNGNTYYAKGGGSGGTNNSNGNGNTGGSAGGASYDSGTVWPLALSNQPKYTGFDTYGNAGGINSNVTSPFPSAGGGGAGDIGKSPTSSTSTAAGDGGAGIPISITGNSVYYGGGGGGSIYSYTIGNTVGKGGLGGGGSGGGDSSGPSNGVSGIDNLGGGGGAATSGKIGGKGGSGVVIISIPTSSLKSCIFSGSGTYDISVSGGNTIIKFTSGTSKLVIPLPNNLLFTSNSTTISTSTDAYRNGLYVFSGSKNLTAVYGSNIEDLYIIGNKKSSSFFTTSNAYVPALGYVYNGFPSNENKVFTTDSNNNIIYGEWIQISLPYKICLTSYSILQRLNNAPFTTGPHTWYIYGSNDSFNWYLLDSRSNYTAYSVDTPVPSSFNVNNNSSTYSIYRMVIAISNYYTCQISQWNLNS